MRAILGILKVVAILFSMAMISLFGFGLYVKEHPIFVSNQVLEKFAHLISPDYSLVSNGGKIYFAGGNFILKVDALTLQNNSKNTVYLKNINHIFSLYNFSNIANAEIVDSNLLNHFPLQADAKLQAMVDDFNNQHQLKFSGKLTANYFLFFLRKVDIELFSQDGKHIPNKPLPNIEIDNVNIRLSYSKNILNVDQFELKYKNKIFASLNGKFTFNKKGLSSAKFTTQAGDLPIEYLEGLWPKFLFPDIHEWVTQNISGGMVTKAQAKVNLSEADLISKDLVSKESVAAEIYVKDAKLRFAEKFTNITNIKGIVKIDGHSLNFQGENASYLNSKLLDANLDLFFDKMDLALKTKIEGNVNNFAEFIPGTIIQDLKSYTIDYKLIEGKLKGDVTLKLPVAENFNIKKLSLLVKADVENIVLDAHKIFKITKGGFELSNESNKINFRVTHANKTTFDILKHHNIEDSGKDYLSVNANFSIVNEFNLRNFNFKKGDFTVKLDVGDDSWTSNIDLSKAEFIVSPIGIKKEENAKFILDCRGNINLDNEAASENCSISGKQASGDVDILFSLEEKVLKSLALKNINIGPNRVNLNLKNNKGFYSIALFSKYLDLSKFDFENKDNSTSNYFFTFKIDNALLKNEINFTSFNGSIKQLYKKPPEINISAFSDNEKISFIKTFKNDQDFYSLYSSSASVFTKAFGISNNIKKGDILVEFTPGFEDKEIIYEGKVKATNFYLSNTSVLSKIILGILSPLNSPQALAQSFQGGSLKADIATADLHYKKGILTIKNGFISGSSYSVKIEGYVDLNQKNMIFKGIYIPSFYGINTFVSMLPLFGKLLTGGDKSAFIAASFSFKGNFDSVKISFNPVSVFTPGFLRNIFN